MSIKLNSCSKYYFTPLSLHVNHLTTVGYYGADRKPCNSVYKSASYHRVGTALSVDIDNTIVLVPHLPGGLNWLKALTCMYVHMQS